MKKIYKKPDSIKTKRTKHLIFLIVPPILIVLVVLFVYIVAFGLINKKVPLADTLVFNKLNNDETQSSLYEEFPVISYGSNWSTLTIDGLKLKNIPVYFGNDDEIMTKGAGLWLGSRFPGQGKKVVINADVTSYFNELEFVQIGGYVTLDTIYGQYVYKVNDSIIFNNDDIQIFENNSKKETLVLYTEYPRNSGSRATDRRYALICELVSGKEWGYNAGSNN